MQISHHREANSGKENNTYGTGNVCWVLIVLGERRMSTGIEGILAERRVVRKSKGTGRNWNSKNLFFPDLEFTFQPYSVE